MIITLLIIQKIHSMFGHIPTNILQVTNRGQSCAMVQSIKCFNGTRYEYDKGYITRVYTIDQDAISMNCTTELLPNNNFIMTIHANYQYNDEIECELLRVSQLCTICEQTTMISELSDKTFFALWKLKDRITIYHLVKIYSEKFHVSFYNKSHIGVNIHFGQIYL